MIGQQIHHVALFIGNNYIEMNIL